MLFYLAYVKLVKLKAEQSCCIH